MGWWAPRRARGGRTALRLPPGREAAPVRQHQTELDDLAVHAEVGGEHAWRQLGEVLAQDVLARTALRGAARQHGREPPDDFALLAVGRPPLLITGAQLVEGSPRAVHALTELLGCELSLRRGVGQPPELGGLNLELAAELAVASTRRALPQRDRQPPEEPDDRGRERGGPCLGRHGRTPVSVVMVRP